MPDSASTRFTEFPRRPASSAAALGPTIVVAPHPDDESLGCGGLLALLRQAGQPVRTVLVSDGTQSHPNSRRFPAPARQALRAAELAAALTILGVDADQTLHLNLPDGAVPAQTEAGFAPAVARLQQYLAEHAPHTVLVPWRRDPHPDHRATYALVQAACAALMKPPRIVEYLVWAWERATPEELPQLGEVQGWQLDITPVLALKQQAIAAHRSQLAGIIDDDPTGFQLSAAMLAHFSRPVEVYLEGLPTE